jgi:hypothetical protein
MEDVKEGKYQKKLVSSSSVEDNAKSAWHGSVAVVKTAVCGICD